MPRYKLIIEYDGARFHGWQRQQNEPSVQETIEQAIKVIFNEEVLIEGAGRTDAGVHALAQVAHVDLSHEVMGYRLCDGLNSYLRNQGIAILHAEIVPPNFHARFSAIGRAYEYRIINRRAPLALDAHQAWHVIPSLNVEKMQTASQHFLGHHDFTSFRTAHCQASTPWKTIDKFDIHHTKTQTGILTARIESRSFLHNQVRIMMGTLKLVGEGRLMVDDIPRILEACDRRLAGPTAPPQGLYLTGILY